MRSFRATLILAWVLASYMDASNGEELAKEYIYTMPVNEPTLINTWVDTEIARCAFWTLHESVGSLYSATIGDCKDDDNLYDSWA